MANVTTLHQLKASAQYMGEAAQRFVDHLAGKIVAGDRQADGVTAYRSNAVTTTAVAVKASAAKLYGVIIEPSATGTTGTGGTGFLQIYNAATITDLVPGGGTAVTLTVAAVKFITGMIRCISFDPAAVDNTELFSSGICVVVATTPAGSTAVASLPKLTIVYS